MHHNNPQTRGVSTAGKTSDISVQKRARKWKATADDLQNLRSLERNGPNYCKNIHIVSFSCHSFFHEEEIV